MRIFMNIWVLLTITGCSSETLQPPATIDFQTLRQGGTGAVRVATDLVVARTQSEWEAAWRLPITDQHGAYWTGPSGAPAVEFAKYMVLGIVFPAWPNGCTSVTITSVRQINGHLNVEYSGYRHRPDEVCTSAFRAPYVFVTVPFAEGDVRFVETPAQ